MWSKPLVQVFSFHLKVSIPGCSGWTLQLIAFDNAETFPRPLTVPTFTQLIISYYNAQYLGHV